MSLFFDFNVNPNSVRFRRAVLDDISEIQTFVTDLDKSMFVDADIGSLIELSALAICMINDRKQVVGFIALGDSPNVPGVDPAGWEFWIRNFFQRYYLPRNTLFIHFISCREHSNSFLEEALTSVFLNDFYLLQIILVAPPNSSKEFYDQYYTFKKKNFYRYYSDCSSPYLCTALRREFCPSFKIRRAVEEDNDDIVNILHKRCPQLKELYGEYYISEIIGRRPDSNRKVLAAEYQEKVVGVICLNTEMEYEILQNEYDLTPFYGLRKASAFEKEKTKRNNSLLETFGEPIMRGQWSPFNELQKSDNKSKGKKKLVQISKKNLPLTKGTISFMDHDTRHVVDMSTPLPDDGEYTKETEDATLEADPFEYDIVNIDESLMRMSQVISHTILPERKSNTSNISEHRYRNRRFSSIAKLKSSKTKKIPKMFTNLDGEANAFAVELLALRDDFDERKDFDLLESCYEIFPDYEYCIIRKPCTETSFSLLQHFCYVPARKNVDTKHALYVSHRSSIRGKLRVRQAELIDIPQIAQLINTLDAKDVMWNLENNIINDREHQVYVFLTGLSVIGFGILESSDCIDYIRTKYNMDSYQNHKYYARENGSTQGVGVMKNIIVHPAFEVHYRFFAREMMRFSGNNSLIWITSLRSQLVIQKLNSFISHLIPLIPRLSEIDCVPKKGVTLPVLSEEDIPFSTWLLNKKMTSIPKITIDTKILIVGASSTAMGFLDELLFSDASSYLTFTNITLVSVNGLPYVRKRNKISELMFRRFRTSTNRFMKSSPYAYYLNLLQGTMVEINQKEKFIRLKSGCKCNYDLLFLLFGKQYQYPDYEDIIKEIENNAINYNNNPDLRLDMPQNETLADGNIISLGDAPENVFVINHIRDAIKALQYVKKLAITLNGKIIVYGATIEAYCCLTTLLEMNVPGSRIVFVEPFPPENKFRTRVSIFANEHVDTIVKNILDKNKVTKYEGYFDSWAININNIATQVQFICYYQAIKLDCDVLFYYGTKGIDLNSFTAINASGMAYNGGIVIDYNCQTRDKDIYAAGPITRYYNQYYAEKWRHKYYDSNEIGRKLGSLIRNKLDPLFASTSNQNNSNSINEDISRNNLSLKQPIVVHCLLPGRLQYLEVRSPGKKIPHHYVQNMMFNGHIIQTFKGGYFKLHFNSNLVVDAITCLTSDMTSLENFKNLYGHSATSLNNIHIRYRLKTFDNLFTFFQSPWAFHLYHDHGSELLLMAQQLLPQDEPEGKTMMESLKDIANSTSENSLKTKLIETFKASPYIESIMKFVIQWLSENECSMSTYSHVQQSLQVTFANNEDSK